MRPGHEVHISLNVRSPKSHGPALICLENDPSPFGLGMWVLPLSLWNIRQYTVCRCWGRFWTGLIGRVRQDSETQRGDNSPQPTKKTNNLCVSSVLPVATKESEHRMSQKRAISGPTQGMRGEGGGACVVYFVGISTRSTHRGELW